LGPPLILGEDRGLLTRGQLDACLIFDHPPPPPLFRVIYLEMSLPEVRAAVPNGNPPPDLDLPVSIQSMVALRIYVAIRQYPDSAEVITSNILKLIELTPNPCVCTDHM
jgi:hypothetical protein